MNWFNILALIGLAAGFIGGWSNFKSLRTAREDANVLVAWKQEPAPWRHEGVAYLVIGIHSVSTILLGGLMLLVFNMAGGVPEIPFLKAGGETHLIYLLLAIFPVFQAGLVAGTGLAFPIGGRLIRPIPYAVTETGVRYGRADLPWKLYSHYETDPMTGVTRLFSASCPGLANCTLMPPPELAAAVVDQLRRHLPAQPPLEIPGTRTPWVLVAGMSLLALAFLLPGIWLVRVPPAWPYYFFAMFLLQEWGMKLIHYFDPSGKPASKKEAG